MITNILIVLLVLTVVGTGYLCIKAIRGLHKPASPQVINNHHSIDLEPIRELLDRVPKKVLETIQGSSNGLQGKLGELVGYLKLHAMYDRIIPMGDIADFVCIRFGKEGSPGTVDFVDIKTGKARLSNDQKELKKLLDQKLVTFTKYKVDINEGID